MKYSNKTLGYFPIIDCHTHSGNNIGSIENIMKIKENNCIKVINILSLTGSSIEKIDDNILCMLFKKMYPEDIFIFAGLPYLLKENLDEGNDILKNLKKQIDNGFDGLKMIEGKPDVKKDLKYPLNSLMYYEMYDYLQKNKIPIIMHIADPENFWDINKIPSWALENGWYYGGGTYPKKESIYGEINDILKNFPELKIIFAHFYFMSSDIERASEFLEKWPGVSFDLTPGREMYENFSKYPEKWREFFVKYQDRIMFGTDNTDDIEKGVSRINTIRLFLETEDTFKAWDLNINGIKLEKNVLTNIYSQNFERYAGKTPKKINNEFAIEECRRVLNIISHKGNINFNIDRTKYILERIKS